MAQKTYLNESLIQDTHYSVTTIDPFVGEIINWYPKNSI